ncbi:alpha/beta hydrolase [Rhizobium leguminosarum]|nr:alpha/beta hydrolase [Rhizobium leguminosarum]
MSHKPTIILVHGFWGGAAHWGKVILELAHRGYQSVHAAELPLTSLAEDAERTRKMVAQQKGPVVLVGHSYGGAVITEAEISRMSRGLSISPHSLPTKVKVQLLSRNCIRPRQWPISSRTATATSGSRPINFTKASARICLPKKVSFWRPPKKAPLAGTFGDVITAPAWRKKPSWYQIASEDRMIAPENQAAMSARLGARRVMTLEASHALPQSKPLEVAAFIDEAAMAVSK